MKHLKLKLLFTRKSDYSSLDGHRRGSGNFELLRFALASHPSETTEHPRGTSIVPRSEFGHLLVIIKLAGYPRVPVAREKSEFGHFSRVGRLMEDPGLAAFSGIGKPAEHPKTFIIGTFVTSTTLCINSSYHYAEIRGWTRLN